MAGIRYGWAAAAVCAGAGWNGLWVRRYRLRTGKGAAGFRLALLSDLHGAWYGEGQRLLLRRLRQAAPDAVLLVGDMMPDRGPAAPLEALLAGLQGRLVFYVTGNHEYWWGRAEEARRLAAAFGACSLAGDSVLLKKGESRLCICGVDDPEGDFLPPGSPQGSWLHQLRLCREKSPAGVFTVLLSHRPERAGVYEEMGFDAALCGHAHGGQVRIPGLCNGLYAPNQGFLPDYAGGLYPVGASALLVSRGLAKNHLPRVFNPPELVLLDLLPDLEKNPCND